MATSKKRLSEAVGESTKVDRSDQIGEMLPDPKAERKKTTPKKSDDANKSGEVVTFSMRISREKKASWQAYCKAKKLTIGEASALAFSEYEASHELSATEKKSYQKHFDSYMD